MELIPHLSELNQDTKNLLVLDDCFLGKQNKAEAYYTRGRHNNCDTIFLSQSYFRLPCQTIRENCNFILLFQQDIKNVNHINADHCSDIPLGEFKNFCKQVWSTKHAFVTIDLTSKREISKESTYLLHNLYITSIWTKKFLRWHTYQSLS